MPVWRSNPVRDHSSSPGRLAAGSQCLPGGPVRVPRTMLPGSRGPRRVAPVRRAGRSTVSSNSPLNRPPRRGWPSEAAGGYRGHAREHRWQADVLGRGRGRPLFRGQGLEPTRPRPRVTRTCPPAWRGYARCGAAPSQRPMGGARGPSTGVVCGAAGSPWPRGEQRTAMFPPRPLAAGASALLHPGSCCGRYHTGRQARRAVLPRR